MNKTIWLVILILWMMVPSGLVYANSGDKAGSKEVVLKEIVELEEELKKNPFDPDLHYILAGDYWRLKKLDEAIHHFREVVKLNPENYSAHWNLSLLYNQKGEGEDAIIHMKKAENIFLEMEDVKSVAKARKTLRQYFHQYDYKPEDFEVERSFIWSIFN